MTRALVFFALASLVPCAGAAQARPAPTLPNLSDPALVRADFEFTVARPDGSTLALETFEGRLIFVHFWATYCGVCVGGMPALQRLWESFRDREDVVFVMVAKDRDPATVITFMDRHGYDFPVYLRAGKSDVFSASGIPLTYIVDPAGDIRARVSGRSDWSVPAVRTYLLGLAPHRAVGSD